MNDKQIRKILIAWIQATYSEVRIYQEKSIGSSICDVMAVTDKLIGFEIKSDCDNYSRLEKQIKSYEQFFDNNYLVVSGKHLRSAFDKIPEEWGIISVSNENICVERPAKFNYKVSRRSQLSVLWKLELKNLLIKNGLPMYAQRDKGYIASKLAERVLPSDLGRQIAEELMNRDYSVFHAQDYTIRSMSEKKTELPQLDIVDTLSEENLSEFTLDQWIALYQKAKELQAEKEQKYQKEAAKVEMIPHEIPYTDIEVSLGVPWISPAIVDEFITHLLGMKYFRYHSRWVEYESVTGSWSVNGKRSQYLNVNATVKYGLQRYDALCIIEATLNLREIKIFDKGNIYNETDTIAALEKQKLIIEEFRRWVWEDEDRCWEIEDAYNRMFAGLEQKQYDGRSLQFPDMNPDFALYPYQKDAVQKIISTQNTLLAFDVGAGKTYIMIAAAMKMRSEGISRKNLFVVPNNIVGQWEKIFTTLYPNAKVLTIEPKTYKPELRQKVLKQIRDGDYDGIIIAYSCFEMIPLSLDYVTSQMNEKLRQLDEAVQNLRESTGWVWGENPLQREKKYIWKLTQDFISSMHCENGSITFDQLEINTIFLDEAHNYKNIPLRTSLKNICGISTKESAKCIDMMQKIRCIQQNNGGRGAVFATGTPLCNSISDAYAMQMYLQYDVLCTLHLDRFDNWVKTFAEPQQLCEIDVDTSKFRFVRRLSRFFNLPELSKLFSQVAIFHAMETKDGLPVLEEYTDVVIGRNQALSDYMKTLCLRTERIRATAVDRRQDNMLKVSIDGRKAALDLELVGETQPDETSKVFSCAEKVSAIYKKYQGCSQLVFCDYSTPKGENFSVYEKLKGHLIHLGIPEKEIAFIHSYHSESRKLELYRKVNEGKIRILIGSTFKLGIGANVQTKLKAVHHLDVPWRPADMVQREGRILRRGNENSEVYIYRYIAEGSFDSYSWQILETKQRFISQFLEGSTYQRTATDLETNILTYAEVKALALSNPQMKELTEKENELRNLKILRAKHNAALENLRKELEEIPLRIPDMSKVRNTLTETQMLTNSDFENAAAEYRDALTAELIMGRCGSGERITILGFAIEIPENQNSEKPYIFLSESGIKYSLQVGKSAHGNCRRVLNFIKGFDKTFVKLKKMKHKLEHRMFQIKAELQKSEPYTEQIDALQREVDGLKADVLNEEEFV